jgi:hypothetical protein
MTSFCGINRKLDFFHKSNALIRIIKLIFKITNTHSKGLERNIRDVAAKKGHYLMFLIRFWHFK